MLSARPFASVIAVVVLNAPPPSLTAKVTITPPQRIAPLISNLGDKGVRQHIAGQPTLVIP